ncbi:hypothetical protein [Spiroplasma melliferum]|uniref:Uncharacterized protein n=2 Tax=Spiroplasma melliferum TaxID=2134 RepID=A0AAI9T3Y5_SPIME|nr:hypothetical protein [Spiroplasma melliferum]ELL44890.1 hypothetical protein SMIPMB4A_v3c1300 [Spiroplasma melliferum IPMB4A]KAI92655.1 hypothetical protein SPM_001030 [Spiroplasma melliferum KC3]QCO24266.1 hypothetical protein SRED_002755 [Spiroplasma melliferum]
MNKIEFLINLDKVNSDFKKLLKDFDKLENKYLKIIKKDKNLKETINLEELSDIKNVSNELYTEVIFPHFQHKNEEIIPNGREIIETVTGTYQNLKTKVNNFVLNTDKAITDAQKNTQWYLPKSKINPIAKPPRVKLSDQELLNLESQPGPSGVQAQANKKSPPSVPSKPHLTELQKKNIIAINKQVKNMTQQENQQEQTTQVEENSR